MAELLIKVLITAYAATAIVDMLAYWPTIKDLYKHKKPSANAASYGIWAITTGTAFLYSLFVLPDILFQIVTGTMFISNLVIVVLTLRLQREHNKLT